MSASPGHSTKPVHIRDVPADVVDILQARARAAGMSLTAYLRNHMVEMAAQPTMSEWIESATSRSWGVDREAIVQAVRDSRDEDHPE